MRLAQVVNINFGSPPCLIVIKSLLCIVFRLTMSTQMRELVPVLGAHLAVGVTDHGSRQYPVVPLWSDQFLSF